MLDLNIQELEIASSLSLGSVMPMAYPHCWTYSHCWKLIILSKAVPIWGRRRQSLGQCLLVVRELMKFSKAAGCAYSRRLCSMQNAFMTGSQVFRVPAEVRVVFSLVLDQPPEPPRAGDDHGTEGIPSEFGRMPPVCVTAQFIRSINMRSKFLPLPGTGV